MSKFRKLKNTSALLFCFALFTALGGQWMVFQSVAWAKMLWTATHTSPVLTAAVIKTAAVQTFDGKHPCGICKKIVKAKAKEKSKTPFLTFQMSVFPQPDSVNIPPCESKRGPKAIYALASGNPIARTPPPTAPPRA